MPHPHPTRPAAPRGPRQAIFDRELQVYGYELLYRGPRERDGERASSVTLLDAFLDLGMERVVGRHRAFINLTRRFFTELPPLPLQPDRLVLEILEDIPVDGALLDGLAALRARGFQLALDDYQFEPRWDPVLPWVDIVKVDVIGAGWEAIERHLPSLHAPGRRLLAEKVEHYEDFRRLQDLGFDYFQGYFFARPQLLSGRRLQENHAVVLRLLARINDPAIVMGELESLITQDPGLSYKVLRFINSAAVGLPRQVESIRQAIIYMGLDRIRGWASLLALSGVEKKPQEVMVLGLTRAYSCEALTRLSGQGLPDTAYTVGLFSVLDAMLDLPMPDILAQLPLPPEVAAALADRSGLYGTTLARVLALERNESQPTPISPPSEAQAAQTYLECIERADQALMLLR